MGHIASPLSRRQLEQHVQRRGVLSELEQRADELEQQPGVSRGFCFVICILQTGILFGPAIAGPW